MKVSALVSGPTRTCKVHNVQFYEPEVRAIHCMAIENFQLALSRSDGTVEVWNVVGTPYLQRTMYAGSVESLAWSKGRLFSAGLHGSILEYNLLELGIRHTMPLIGGAAWCVAADKQNTMLAAGTEEGYVNVLELLPDETDAPRPLRLLDKQEGRVLCLSWHPDGKQLVTGSIDNIRLWDVATGRGIRRMSLAQEYVYLQTRRKLMETTVWYVAVTSDGVGVSADSRGFVTFWDLQNGVIKQAVRTHRVPVLAAALDSNSQTLYCSGVDPVVAVLHLDPSSNKWVRGVDRNLHEHDVRALACGDGKLFSGGVDGHVVVSSYPPKSVHKHPPLLHDAVKLSASRLLLLRHTKHLEVWALGTLHHKNSDAPANASQCRHLLRLTSRHKEHMVCADIAPDGTHLAYATPNTTRLVSLGSTKSWALPCGAGGALVLTFCPTESRLALATRAGAIVVFALGGRPRVLATIEARKLKQLPDSIGLLSFSADGSHLAGSDMGGAVAVWRTSDWTAVAQLPRAAAAATALCQRPGAVMAVYADHSLVELSLSTSLLTPFSTAFSSLRRRSRDVLSRLSPVTRAAWDPARPRHLLLADEVALYGVAPPLQGERGGAKVPRTKGETMGRMSVIGTHKHLVFADWLGDDELVVVETSPDQLQRGLPAIIRKGRFGTK